MKKYYVNKNPQNNGDHEVHHEGCIHMPSAEQRLYLGAFPSCLGAVSASKRRYRSSDGCKICSNLCHTR
jgi:hypothetical protein